MLVLWIKRDNLLRHKIICFLTPEDSTHISWTPVGRVRDGVHCKSFESFPSDASSLVRFGENRVRCILCVLFLRTRCDLIILLSYNQRSYCGGNVCPSPYRDAVHIRGCYVQQARLLFLVWDVRSIQISQRSVCFRIAEKVCPIV